MLRDAAAAFSSCAVSLRARSCFCMPGMGWSLSLSCLWACCARRDIGIGGQCIVVMCGPWDSVSGWDVVGGALGRFVCEAVEWATRTLEFAVF